MKHVMKNKSIVLLGSLAGTCLMATVVFANPSMVPDHPGYPMKASSSPVSNVPTANDPGQENLYEQKALSAATKSYNKGMEIRRAGQLVGVNQSEGQNQMSEKENMTKQN